MFVPRPNLQIGIKRPARGVIGGWNARAAGLGGWTLNVHHAYDLIRQTLLLGDGGRWSTQSVPPIITTTAALFQQHLVNEFPAVFSFLFDPTLDATNWRAEQALRPAVITRKTCGGGNRTTRGAASQQVLTSVLRTADQRGLAATDVLVSLLTAPTPTVPRSLRTVPALH